jgi:hypothetical protein
VNLAVCAALSALACGNAGDGAVIVLGHDAGTGATRNDAAVVTPAPARWKPSPRTSWQWQLTGALDQSVDAAVFYVDLFDTSDAQVATLHASGKKVVCYLDAAYEPGRPDADRLAPYAGEPVGRSSSERWVDIRQTAVLDVMQDRIALAGQKRCDAVAPDAVDPDGASSGFPLTVADRRAFIRALSDDAHARELSFGLKGAVSDVPALVDTADFVINEQCFQYSECTPLAGLAGMQMAVFQVEYTDGDLAQKGAEICPEAARLGFETLIKHQDLGAARFACP